MELEDLAQKYNLRSVSEAETWFSEDFNCPDCYAPCNRDRKLRRMIGWCWSTYWKPLFAVFECQKCGRLYRHHIGDAATKNNEEAIANFMRYAELYITGQR